MDVQRLFDLGEGLFELNTTDILKQLQEASHQCLEENDHNGWVYFQSRIALIRSYQGDYEQAKSQFSNLERQLDAETAHPVVRSMVYRSLGEGWSDQGEEEDAERCLTLAVTEMQQLPTSSTPIVAATRARAFCSLGNWLQVQGRTMEAEKYIKQAIPEAERAGYAAILVFVLRSWGEALSSNGLYAEAEDYLQKAAVEAEDSTATNAIAKCYAFLSWGEFLRMHNRFPQAEDYLQKAAKQADTISVPRIQCIAYRALGDLFRLQERLKKAEYWLRRAVEVTSSIHDPLTCTQAFHGLGELLIDLKHYDEANKFLQRALEEGERLTDPFTKCSITRSCGRLATASMKLDDALEWLATSKSYLLSGLRQNRRPRGIANLISSQANGLFELGQLVSEIIGGLYNDQQSLLFSLDFVDAAKCVSIREGLRRYSSKHSRTVPQQGTWQPSDFDELPLIDNPPQLLKTTSGQVASRQTEENWKSEKVVLEIPGEEAHIGKQAILEGELPSTQDLEELLPDKHTVLVVFFFRHGDLVVLPIRRNELNCPEVLIEDNNCFVVQDAEKKVFKLIRRQAQFIQTISDGTENGRKYGEMSAEELNCTFGSFRSLYQGLYQLLSFDQLLKLIEPNEINWKNLHVILIPDGPLAQLPLHAACCPRTGVRLYEQVHSLRYGLSIRILKLLKQVEMKQPVEVEGNHLRGVFFGNRDLGSRAGPPLPSVWKEAQHLFRQTPSRIGGWWIHGDWALPDQLPTQSTFRERYGSGNVLWYAGHGGTYQDEFLTNDGRVVKAHYPALWLHDTAISTGRMVEEGYDFAHVHLVHLSACLLGEWTLAATQTEAPTRELEGFLGALTLLRCRRVSSAMWRLADDAAAEFAHHWIRELVHKVFTPHTHDTNPHAFAIALREALSSFRQAEDGRFDHEFFWAPYTLYGLG